jgi:hypothetical protein
MLMAKRDNYPDPSLINPISFYSSAFQIKKLLRRRGWQDVAPMGDDVCGLMPQKLFNQWESFSERKALVKEKSGGKEFERFVAQIIAQHYCNPATFSNKVKDLSPGGDYDVLVEGPGESLFHFETKTSVKQASKSVKVADIWNFMVREASLGPDMSVFLYDTNFDLQELIMPVFEILYSLAQHIQDKKAKNIDIDRWKEKASKGGYVRISKQLGKSKLFYLYWPVLVTSGGDSIQRNIGEALSVYYGGIKHIAPFEFGKRPTREAFTKLKNWNQLPKKVRGNIKEKDIISWAKKSSQTKT